MAFWESKVRVGRPNKYKHGRALSTVERVRAMRAKRTLVTAPVTSLKYKKAKLQLEELYSEGINPNKARTELKDRFGQRVDIHGFGWKDADYYQEELKQDRYWGVRMANKRRKKYDSVAERVAAWRLRKKIEEENKEEDEEEEEE